MSHPPSGTPLPNLILHPGGALPQNPHSQGARLQFSYFVSYCFGGIFGGGRGFQGLRFQGLFFLDLPFRLRTSNATQKGTIGADKRVKDPASS
eukprot:252906-Amphidinium_carterae.1